MPANLVIAGSSWTELELQGNAWFQPGKKLFLEMGLDKDLSEENLTKANEVMSREGVLLLSPLAIGTGVWPNTLRVEFKNPKGFSVSPFLAGTTSGSVGIGGILGWRIGRILEKSFLPLLVIGGTVALGILLLKRKH